ncbi:MAG: NAD(P)-dependent oxidoreductase [bacterium]
MNIAITGATGFLGKRFAQWAIREGNKIICLVHTPQKATDLIKNGAEIVYGDIRNKEVLSSLMQNAGVCVHLAAHVHNGSHQSFRQVNVDGTENICQTIIQYAPWCRLVHCSSIAALRVNPRYKFLATDYALSKWAADRIVQKYIERYGLQVTFVYPGLIYGPGDKQFLPTLIHYLGKNRVFLVRGGEKSAPLIYIDDLCRLFMKVATDERSVGKHYLGIQEGEIGIHDFIRLLATNAGYRLPSLILPKIPLMGLAIIVEAIYYLFGNKQSPFLSKRAIDIVSINADFPRTRFSNDLGWRAEVSIEEGLKRTLNGY